MFRFRNKTQIFFHALRTDGNLRGLIAGLRGEAHPYICSPGESYRDLRRAPLPKGPDIFVELRRAVKLLPLEFATQVQLQAQPHRDS